MFPSWVEHLFYQAMDLTFEHIPRANPALEQLKKTKIISHRGERDNKSIFENTFAAFDPVLEAKVYGIELDIRWSKDLVPMVIHDEDLQRVFSSSMIIADNTAEEIQSKFPQIPTLEQLIERYGKKLHLMIELKREQLPLTDRHNEILQNVLASLTPGQDYHLISLSPEIFKTLNFAPNSAYFPISQISSTAFSNLAIEHGYAGLMGHYALLSKSTIKRHLDLNQMVGTGHIASKNCLFREINRRVEWIFTNSAVKIQNILNNTIQS